MNKRAKDLPIDQIHHNLDGAARDNTFYQWLLEACDIIEELRKRKEMYDGQSGGSNR